MILTFLFCSFVFRLNSDAQKHKGWKRYGIIFCLLGGIISSAIFYGRTESYYIAKDRSVSCLFISARCLNSGYISAAVQNESTARKEGDIISQSFDTKINFNTIIIPVRKFYTESRIEVTLSEENGKLLDSKVFTSKELGEYNAIVYHLPKVIRNYHPQKYVIRIKKEDNLKESVCVPIYKSGNIDIYKKGVCISNDNGLKKADLLFNVLYTDQIKEEYIRSVYLPRR